MNWYVKVLKQFFDFIGRARRKEYWMFILFHVLALVAAAVIDTVAGIGMPGMGPVYLVYALVTFIPGLGAAVRRLHDTDRSGWWILLSLIPLAGLVVLVFLALEGSRGTNRFGADPKADGYAAA